MSRTASFEVRCTPAEKAAWKQAAGRRGLSELARRSIVAHLEARDKDGAAVGNGDPSPPGRPAAAPTTPTPAPAPPAPAGVTAGGSIERAAQLLQRRPARPVPKSESAR